MVTAKLGNDESSSGEKLPLANRLYNAFTAAELGSIYNRIDRSGEDQNPLLEIARQRGIRASVDELRACREDVFLLLVPHFEHVMRTKAAQGKE